MEAYSVELEGIHSLECGCPSPILAMYMQVFKNDPALQRMIKCFSFAKARTLTALLCVAISGANVDEQTKDFIERDPIFGKALVGRSFLSKIFSRSIIEEADSFLFPDTYMMRGKAFIRCLSSQGVLAYFSIFTSPLDTVLDQDQVIDLVRMSLKTKYAKGTYFYSMLRKHAYPYSESWGTYLGRKILVSEMIEDLRSELFPCLLPSSNVC